MTRMCFSVTHFTLQTALRTFASCDRVTRSFDAAITRSVQQASRAWVRRNPFQLQGLARQQITHQPAAARRVELRLERRPRDGPELQRLPEVHHTPVHELAGHLLHAAV